MKLSNLKPKPVWQYFNEIRKIPRCSGKEEQIGDYLLSIARKHDLTAEKDAVSLFFCKEYGSSKDHLRTLK